MILSRARGTVPMLMLLTCLGCQKSETPTSVVATKTGIDMVLIPAGYFNMGSQHGRDDEKPVHKVWLDAFLMDRHEVTQEAYEKLGTLEAFPNPSHFKGATLPVEQIKWDQAARFCNARSRFEGLKPCYNEDTAECDFEADGYRLPTEAEWEYACRAGTETEYSFGGDARKLGDYGWSAENSGKKTHPIGQKRANPWGLVDMHGNVAEWCQDVFDATYYKTSPERNPRGPAEGKEYALRGGSWKSTTDTLRSSYRVGETPGFSDACLARDAIGFRCVRRPPAEKIATK